MKRLLLATALAAILALALAATAQAGWVSRSGCVSNSTTPNCQYMDTYRCSGTTIRSYRYYDYLYNFSTGQTTYYKETYSYYVATGGRIVGWFVSGWGYAPC